MDVNVSKLLFFVFGKGSESYGEDMLLDCLCEGQKASLYTVIVMWQLKKFIYSFMHWQCYVGKNVIISEIEGFYSENTLNN